MTVYQPGQTAIFEHDYGTDADAITFEILDADLVPVLGPTPYGIAHPAAGAYLYAWPVPASEASGGFTARFAATFGATVTISDEAFTVGPAGGGAWCTVADVLAFTGYTVAQANVTTAQGSIEALIHRVWRDTDADKRDYYWLSRAVAWQSAYHFDHPELLTMMDVSSISQDGLSITFKATSASMAMYSPVALRFLSAVFRGSNTTIRFNSAFQKNRLTKLGVTAGTSVPWTNL
jgi:hypothetical protein